MMISEWFSMNKSSMEFSEANSSIIKNICSPLAINFDIKFFIYQKYLSDGKYLSLSNNININKYYIENIECISPIFENAIQNIDDNKPYYFMWPNSVKNLDYSQELILSKMHSADVWNGFTVYKRNKNTIESWSFASNVSNTNIINFYINNINKINHFILYFNNKILELLNIDDKNKLATFKVLPDFYKRKDCEIKEEINNFFYKTPIKRCFINIDGNKIIFSKREVECIKHMMNNNTAKEIGRLLGLSHRTVEYYLYRIKNKTNSRSYSELINIAKENWII